MDPHDFNQAFSKAINFMGINLYKELAKDTGNVLFSPLSVSCALSMAFVGSDCETAEEMGDVLGYNLTEIKYENIKSHFEYLLSEMNQASDDCTLSNVNVVLTNKQFSIQEEFKQTFQNYFKALFVEVDFIDGLTEALNQANEWVKNKTNGTIPQLLDSLDSDTRMVILSATYFKSFWLHQFKGKDTFLQYFYNEGIEEDAKLVDMMHLNETFLYTENATYKALELPYKGEQFSMLVLLPNSRDGVQDLESLISYDFLKNLKGNMLKTEVEVALPKFCLEYSKSLKDVFQKLGMKWPFIPGAHFNKISDSERLFISEIIHKAVIEVNERGTEASAATAVSMVNYCFKHSPEFIVDHPFLFLLYDCKNDLVFFIGKVEKL